MLHSGINEIYFDLSTEPNSIKKQFLPYKDVIMEIKLKNISFEPVKDKIDKILFYGYLSQILEYKINVDGEIVTS
jgi:hypothetical protein